MRIRLADESDLPAILDLLNREIRDGYAHFGTVVQTVGELRADFERARASYPWLVAEQPPGDDDRPPGFMGFARCAPWKTREAYDWTVEGAVYVHPDHRNYGVGQALYAKLIPILRAQGYHLLVGGIALPNAASVRVHESVGMKRVATFERIGYKQGQWRNVGYWAITLAPDPLAEPVPVKTLDQIDVAPMLD